MSGGTKGILIAGLLFGLWAQATSGGLREYVNKPDPTYSFEIVKTEPMGNDTVYLVRLKSQTWRDIVWEHWLGIIKPPEVAHPDKAMLLISGGDNEPGEPKLDLGEAQIMAQFAEQTKSITAVLMQVPNQPLFNGLTEDGIIAYTFEEFLKGQSDDWPLLLPMTKSAVRAMDTIQAVAKKEFNQDITGFMTLGGSKRGWTTWLTAVVDPRVKAIAPAVIDTLNMGEQMKHQLDAYGAYSEEIADYTNRNLPARMQTPDGQKLLAVVDPYSYRSQLTLPKLLILGTNDPYWTVDSSSLYYSGLKGVKYLHYGPNTGHDVEPTGLTTIMAFYDSIVLKGKKMPEVWWKKGPDGSLVVSWSGGQAKPNLWKAQSPNRDFRNSEWKSEPIVLPRSVPGVPPSGGTCTAKVETPKQGRVAYYVELVFSDAPTGPYCFCTTITVAPDTFPKHEKRATAAGTQGPAAGTQGPACRKVTRRDVFGDSHVAASDHSPRISPSSPRLVKESRWRRPYPPSSDGTPSPDGTPSSDGQRKRPG